MTDYRLLIQPHRFVWDETTPFSSIRWPVGGVLAYLIVIVSGRRLMRRHNPFDMRRVFLAHNAILCVWSISMCIGCAIYALSAMFVSMRGVRRRSAADFTQTLPSCVRVVEAFYCFEMISLAFSSAKFVCFFAFSSLMTIHFDARNVACFACGFARPTRSASTAR